MSIDVFAEHFSMSPNLRQSAKVTCPLCCVLFLSIRGVITGCEGWEDNKGFGHACCGSIKPDTIARIISSIAPKQLQHSFTGWMQKVNTLTDG